MHFCSLKPKYLNEQKLPLKALIFHKVCIVRASVTMSCFTFPAKILLTISPPCPRSVCHTPTSPTCSPSCWPDSRLLTPYYSAILAPLFFLKFHLHGILSCSETYTLTSPSSLSQQVGFAAGQFSGSPLAQESKFPSMLTISPFL